MKRIAILTISGFFAATANGAEYSVQRTLQLSTSATEVWKAVGDFCDLDDWHPMITACQVQVIDGSVHRVLTTTDGTEFVEKRIAAEPGLSYTYRAKSSSLPVENYTATFSIEHLNGALISWSGRFSSDDPAMEARMAEMYESGLAAIQAAFE